MLWLMLDPHACCLLDTRWYCWRALSSSYTSHCTRSRGSTETWLGWFLLVACCCCNSTRCNY